MEVTKEQAQRVVEIVDAGLVAGLGKPEPGVMCVEAAVCFALRLPHSDNPPCVDEQLRMLKIDLNDEGWSSPTARAKGLRKLAVLQLGTAEGFDSTRFSRECKKWVDLVALPRLGKYSKSRALQATIQKYVRSRRTERNFLDMVSTIENRLAGAAYRSNIQSVSTVVDFMTGYMDFPGAVLFSGYVRAAFDINPHWSCRREDKELAWVCEEVAKILIKMNVPGVQWLPLLETAHDG